MQSFTLAALAGASVFALSGCATLNGTRPEDMTIPEHEQAAAAEQQKAVEAEKREIIFGHGPAWNFASPAPHLQLAKEHTQAAERRRAAVAAACDGVGTPVPFASMRVERVEAIREATVPRELRNARGFYPEYLKGARVAVTTPAGVGAAPAARTIECEAARAAAGLDPASAESPLGVRTARLSVVPADAGLVVEIRSSDSKDAAEILRRAEAMAARAGCH